MHVGKTGAYRVLLGRIESRNYLEDVDLDEKITFK